VTDIPVIEGKLCSLLGEVDYQRGDFHACLEKRHRALQSHKALRDVVGEANALELLGHAHLALKEHDQAQDYWAQATLVREAHGLPLADMRNRIAFRTGATPERPWGMTMPGRFTRTPDGPAATSEPSPPSSPSDTAPADKQAEG
jgi:hypothetical protein